MTDFSAALDQMQAAGLQVEWPLTTGRIVRCKVQGDKGGKKSGWYVVHEFRLTGGDTVLVGKFGNYKLHGPEEGVKIEIGQQITEEDRRQYAEQMKAAQRAADEARRQLAIEAANRANRAWGGLSESGSSEYLTRKKVRAFGIRFALGRIAVPLRNMAGDMVGLQWIGPDGDKKFITGTAKSGAFHIIGHVADVQAAQYGFAEGYATAASVHQATGLPVVVCFDCANLVRVVGLFRAAHPTAQLTVFGDDDAATEGNPGRTAAESCLLKFAARAVFPTFPAGVAGTDWNDLHVACGLDVVRSQIESIRDSRISEEPRHTAAAPDVADESSRTHLAPSAPDDESSAPDASAAKEPEWTDVRLLQRFALIFGETKVFDLQRQQVMKFAALSGLVGKKLADGWRNNPEKKQIDPDDVERLVAAKGAPGKVRDMVERYVLLHGTATAWDMQDRKHMPKAALQMALGSAYSIWENSPDRRVIRAENLVFDPQQKADPATHINTFPGIPMKPADKADDAQPILDLLLWLVNGDVEAYAWIEKWLAFPLQNVGAKMQTAILVHGRNQGAGKTLFFGDVHRAIYGMQLGTTVGQHQLDGQYTEWRSGKLYCVFEEIFSNATKYSHMGTVKHMITGKTQRIEKKFVSGWEEWNHMNVVFLSNENQPLPVEPNDRRLLVIWPERVLHPDITARVQHAMANGGIEAWYRYLLNLDLTGFNEHTNPPMTPAKQRLIDYGLPSWEVFFRDWRNQELQWPYHSCLTSQLYSAYVQWCKESGEHGVLSRNKFTQMLIPFMRRKENVHYLGRGSGSKGTFFMIETQAPEGYTMEKWLGECVEKFERGFGDQAA